jgi:hypothetical protein
MKKFILIAIGTIMTSTALATPPPPPPPPSVGTAQAVASVKVMEKVNGRFVEKLSCTATGSVQVYDMEGSIESVYYGQRLVGCPEKITISGKQVDINIWGSSTSKNSTKSASVFISSYRDDAQPACEICGPLSSTNSEGTVVARGNDIRSLTFKAMKTNRIRNDRLSEKFYIEAEVAVTF